MRMQKVGRFYTVRGLQLLALWGIRRDSVDGGNIKIKPVKCGKDKCKQCPHKFYAYHRNRWGEKYLGVCDEFGRPRKKYEPVSEPLKQTTIPGFSAKALKQKKMS